MINEDKPLSLLVTQGWEIVSYASSLAGEMGVESVLLRKQRAHKILKIRPKYVGKGYVVKEIDV